MGKLEEDFENVLRDKGDNKSVAEFAQLIDAINKAISTDRDEEITYLIPVNVIGINQAEVFQCYLENLFDWRIDVLDRLINQKRLNTKSIDGRLINKKIEALQTLAAKLEAHVNPEIMDRMFGPGLEKR